jgi:succinyl-diaminopimelate desuccinylase
MNVIDLVKELVEIDSSSKDGANKAIEYCAVWLEERGLNVKRISNNGFDMMVTEIGTGEKTLIFNGHVDVVGAKSKQFQPFERNGNLYGRGTADMKAGVAAMMFAMVELKDLHLNCKVQLQIVSDEEIGGFNCSSYLAEHGYLGEFVICAEPTQLGIGLQAKGIIQLDIDIEGDSAHGSRPWEGDNAIVKAYEVYQNILQLPFAKESTEFYPSPSINFSKISGGEVYNKVPDFCSMSFDIRFLPHQTAKDILKQIRTITDGEIRVNITGEPVRTQKNDPHIQYLSTVVGNHTQQDANIFGQHGSADTRFYSAYNIPAVEFGPSGGAWHGDNEYVVIHSINLYKAMLLEYALGFQNIGNQQFHFNPSDQVLSESNL